MAEGEASLKIRLVKLGKVAYPEIKDLVAVYAERLQAFAKVELVEQRAVDGGPVAAPGQLLVILDEFGDEWTSPELASRMQKWSDDPGVKTLTFVVGGPLGLPQPTKDAATVKLALSRATLTSDIAWLVLVEQIYRAFNILKGTGYHHA